MLLRVTQTLAVFACVVMVALVASAYADDCPCATGSPCVTGVPCIPQGYYSQPPRPYCVCGNCCQPSHPWGYADRQWMPWPGEDRDDVGSPATVRGRTEIPTPQGTVPPTLPKEEYPTPGMILPDGQSGTNGGTGGFNFPGTGEAPLPFSVPQVEPGKSGVGLPSGNIPVEQPEGGLSPDILPAEPFSIEGTEDEKSKKDAPADEKKPTSMNQNDAPMPTMEASPIRLGGEAPMPTMQPTMNRPSSLVIQGATLEPLPPTTTSTPAYAPAPMPSIRPSSYTPKRQPAPIYNEPALSNPAAVDQVPEGQDQWRSRRARTDAPEAPMPEAEVAAEGRHVRYEQSAEAPLPEAISTTLDTVRAFALEGYCPVELVLNERWIEGDSQWTATHAGRSYRFSSREAFDSFCRNPDLYAPCYAGVDPIVALVDGQSVEGRTDLCAVYRGRLYMFSCQKSLDQFRANPVQCVEAFEANLKTK